MYIQILIDSKMNTKIEEIYIQKLKQNVVFTIGKNASGNDEAISDAGPEDIWFHLDGQSSCHVIAQVPDEMGRKERGYILRKGAELCKQNSREKSKKNVEVIYAKIKNIVKTEIPGKVIVSESGTIKI
jgi:predicted ribosome quality control (RQC) complex YloA/Tae2 family protein